jgi:putative copper resistance protein D
MQGFLDFADSLLRGGLLVALSLALGGVAWGRFVLRAPVAAGEHDGLARRCAASIALGAGILLLAQLTLLGIRALAIAADLGPGMAPALLATLPFRAGLTRAALAAVLLVAAFALIRAPGARARWQATTLAALLVGASGAWLVHGAGRLEERALLMACTMVHQVAAAVWTGGLVQLGLTWRIVRRTPALAPAWPPLLARFSRLAAVSMVVLVASSSPLVWTYVGSWTGLVGTGYGSILGMKVALLGAALVLAAANRQAVRRWATGGDDTALRATVPPLIEGETILAVLVLFTAATLASQPPAVDVVAERATWPEVVRVFAPKWPDLRTPSVADMEADTSNPQAVTGGERTVTAYSWSNFSHNVAGLFLLAMALLAVAGSARGAAWGRHWPAGFLLLGVFVFLRTSANDAIWPFGPHGVWETMIADAEMLQHRLGAALVVLLGVVEWRTRVRPSRRLAYVFPILAALGGLLLLTHSHAAFEPKSDFLIQVTHTAMGGLAVVMACARWLELRLGPPAARWAGATANVAMLLVALVLVFYQEANVVVPPA